MLKNAIAFFLLMLPMTLLAESPSAETEAKSWLELIDSQEYKKSWDESGEFFRSNISKETWVKAIDAARVSVGEIYTRNLLTEKPLTSLPNAPKGEYVVLRYRSEFAYSNATETLTLRNNNGWHVVGYFIK
ncbi:DUF4019 domain-containing protein [Vibrio amylolyticus]|uniref:DUF4019 domain-containing protein n=1 Tax=Vibrio TaxID=662 RepID=UPI000C85AB69|nr:DUF4019 domain-containing protein [Vibrio sp. 10N.261.55.A7]PMJ92669.1 hypothetical protein BCU12_07350 [Vibrio sp. 10N.261.55.A7]